MKKQLLLLSVLAVVSGSLVNAASSSAVKSSVVKNVTLSDGTQVIRRIFKEPSGRRGQNQYFNSPTTGDKVYVVSHNKTLYQVIEIKEQGSAMVTRYINDNDMGSLPVKQNINAEWVVSVPIGR